MYWLAAEEITSATFEWDGGDFTGTLAELISAHSGRFAIEYEDSTEYYPNLTSNLAFSVNTQPAELIGGVHSPQRPK